MSKIDDGVESFELEDERCNCSAPNRDEEGNCIYEQNCRCKCLIYGANCFICDALYIGSTQANLKSRMEGHMQDVRDFFRTGKRTDSFARHFSKHIENGDYERFLGKEVSEVPTRGEVKQMFWTEVLWYPDSKLSVSRKFKTKDCRLCSEEKLQILKWKQVKEQYGEAREVINRNSDFFAACRHNPKIHSLKR